MSVVKILESKISEFLGMDDTILYTSCFDANGGLFETILNKEEAIINKYLMQDKSVNIIVYDKNANAPNLMKKHDQLLSLGFPNVFIYPGGLFEWLCLQDIYGFDSFPTTKKELDILKFKGKSVFTTYLLGDID